MDQQEAPAVDESPINIVITDSQITKHVSYTIKGDDRIGQFEAIRRYNDFHNLRVVLLQRWPGCYVPPIPSKSALGNNEPKLIEDRKRFLQYFLEQIAKLRHLYFSDEFQTFLRTKNTDIEKVAPHLRQGPGCSAEAIRAGGVPEVQKQLPTPEREGNQHGDDLQVAVVPHVPAEDAEDPGDAEGAEQAVGGAEEELHGPI